MQLYPLSVQKYQHQPVSFWKYILHYDSLVDAMYLGLIFRHYCLLGQCPVIAAAMDWQSVREQKLNRAAPGARASAHASQNLSSRLSSMKSARKSIQEREIDVPCCVLFAFCEWVRAEKSPQQRGQRADRRLLLCVCEWRRDYCCDGRKHQKHLNLRCKERRRRCVRALRTEPLVHIAKSAASHTACSRSQTVFC